MPLYQYRALNQARDELRGEITAESPDQALKKIQEKGLFATSLKEVVKTKPRPVSVTAPVPSSPPTEEGFRPRRKFWFGVSRKALIRFTFQFAQMQEAGLTILRSLQTLERQQGPGLLRRTLRQVCHDVEGGSTLNEALAKHPRVFDDLYVRMVALGEITGELDKILFMIATAKEKILKLQRKVIQILIYPAFVTSFAFGVLMFISLVVLPMIRSVVQEAGKHITGPLGWLLDLSGWFFGGSPPGWLTLGLGVAVAWLGLRLVNSVEPGRYLTDLIKLRIPLFGHILYKVCVSRVSRVLGTLIGAGVPILEALRVTRDTSNNQVFARALTKIREQVREGRELTTCLKDSPWFDMVAINMVEVGEETGDLDKMLLKLADNYEGDVDAMVTYLVSLLEPTLIVIMCLTVGGLVISMFSYVMGMMGGG